MISRTPGIVPSEIAENVKQDDHEQRNTHEPGNQSLHANLLWLSEGDGADHRRIKQAGGMLPMARSVGCVISRTNPPGIGACKHAPYGHWRIFDGLVQGEPKHL